MCTFLFMYDKAHYVCPLRWAGLGWGREAIYAHSTLMNDEIACT